MFRNFHYFRKQTTIPLPKAKELQFIAWELQGAMVHLFPSSQCMKERGLTDRDLMKKLNEGVKHTFEGFLLAKVNPFLVTITQSTCLSFHISHISWIHTNFQST